MSYRSSPLMTAGYAVIGLASLAVIVGLAFGLGWLITSIPPADFHDALRVIIIGAFCVLGIACAIGLICGAINLLAWLGYFLRHGHFPY